MILESISNPNDIKKLNTSELEILCSELRSEIIRITAKNGGHLGSNLGFVEVTVAMNYVFDFPKDKVVFDVGHQSYSYKLLTGRRKIMEDLRNSKGASGFPDPDESEFDSFIGGHASTSISAALGISKARDLNKEDFKVISILGDGSLSGGMIYEAMNNSAGTKNFIVILNDNKMSISESVGSMRMYLSKLLSSKGGLSFRKRLSKFLSWIPKNLSKFIESFIKNSLCAIKGGTIFEEFGFQYIGPIDGHNISDLIKVFENVRDVANYKPVIIHTVTQKGKGYAEAEADSINLHGIDNSKSAKYSDIFGEKIVELSEKDEKIICITAAMKSGCGLTEFSKKFPDRFFDVGIAEEHAITFAAGLAKSGFKPFVCIYSTFLQRGFDQIYHDVFLQKLPVRFIIDKAGFPGNDGKTHSGIYDTAMLQNFPEIMILSPSSKTELNLMLEFAVEANKNPIAIRFTKSAAFDDLSSYGFSINSRVVLNGEKTLIISCGDLLNNVLEAINISKTNPTVVDARFINPFDFDTFYRFSKNHKKIIVLEEGIFGGISNIIIERLIKDKQFEILSKIKFVNSEKNPCLHTTRDHQIDFNNMSPNKIAKIIE